MLSNAKVEKCKAKSNKQVPLNGLDRLCNIVEDDISAGYLTPFLLPSSPTLSEDDESFLSSTSCRFRALLLADPDVLGSQLSDWLPSLYIDPRPTTASPMSQYLYCTYCTYILCLVEYIVLLIPRDYFELSPCFLWTSANQKSTIS